MLVLLDYVVKGSILHVGTPIGSHLRNLIFGGNTSLKKFLVTCDCSSDDVSIVASNTAVLEKIILRMLLIDILIDEVNMRVPFAFLKFSGHLRLFFSRFFWLSLSSSHFSLFNWRRRFFALFFEVFL